MLEGSLFLFLYRKIASRVQLRHARTMLSSSWNSSVDTRGVLAVVKVISEGQSCKEQRFPYDIVNKHEPIERIESIYSMLM